MLLVEEYWTVNRATLTDTHVSLGMKSGVHQKFKCFPGWRWKDEIGSAYSCASVFKQPAQQTLPHATPATGKIHPSSKIAATLEPMMRFRFPLRFRISKTYVM